MSFCTVEMLINVMCQVKDGADLGTFRFERGIKSDFYGFVLPVQISLLRRGDRRSLKPPRI